VPQPLDPNKLRELFSATQQPRPSRQSSRLVRLAGGYGRRGARRVRRERRCGMTDKSKSQAPRSGGPTERAPGRGARSSRAGCRQSEFPAPPPLRSRARRRPLLYSDCANSAGSRGRAVYRWAQERSERLAIEISRRESGSALPKPPISVSLGDPAVLAQVPVGVLAAMVASAFAASVSRESGVCHPCVSDTRDTPPSRGTVSAVV
jgi:hypothetical protein